MALVIHLKEDQQPLELDFGGKRVRLYLAKKSGKQATLHIYGDREVRAIGPQVFKKLTDLPTEVQQEMATEQRGREIEEERQLNWRSNEG